MQKIYIGIACLVVLCIAFCSGYWVSNRRADRSSASYRNEISRISELARSIHIEREAELSSRENSIRDRERRLAEETIRREAEYRARENRLAERERYIREAEEFSRTDRSDLTELSSILAKVRELAQDKK